MKEQFNQTTDYDCGPAAVENLLKRITGEWFDYEQLMRDLKTTEQGTDPENIREYLDRMGLRVFADGNGSVECLEWLMSRGMQILVGWQKDGTEQDAEKLLCGHYSLVDRIEGERIYFLEPDAWDIHDEPDGQAQIEKQDFYKRWRDMSTAGKYYERWFLGVKKIGCKMEE